MRRALMAAVLGVSAALSGSALSAEGPKPGQAEVPVKAVVLFSSGVGYFEHSGTVKDDGATELRFKTQQINDILKSLLLQDMDGGTVTSITYPSQDPIEKTLRSFQVDITKNPSLGELLNQLRGAKVKLVAGGDQAEGTILGLEKKQKPAGDKGTVQVWVLNLISGATIRSVELDSVQKLDLVDQRLQEELTAALSALAQARDQDKKPVLVKFAGKGERRVRIGYVVETPIWKTSYRLVLSDDPKKKGVEGKLQGWAIVENQTDNDWTDAQLSLVSGRPISFIQDLYQPLYVPRPVVQPELYASLKPQTYDAGMMAAGDKRPELPKMEARQMGEQQLARRRSGGQGGGGGFGGAMGGRTALGLEDASREALDPTSSVASVASAAKIGELFEYTVGNVSLPRQRSAMIPIITDPVEVEKLSIYNASVLPKNPLNGARIKNTTGKHLLAGPITVLEGSGYAGDASVNNVPPGQERLISYGIDLQMLVDSTKNREENAVLTGKIVKGALVVTLKYVSVQEYLAENKGEKDKSLIVEHPVRADGWKLTDTLKPIETTESLYRFKVAVPAGKGATLAVKEEKVEAQQMEILATENDTLAVYSKTGSIPKPVRDVLIKAMGMRQAMADTQRQVEERVKKVAEITSEQGRIRDNMKSVAQNSAYYTRLMTKLNDQETSIEKLQGEIESLRKAAEQQKKELADYLSGTTIGE